MAEKEPNRVRNILVTGILPIAVLSASCWDQKGTGSCDGPRLTMDACSKKASGDDGGLENLLDDTQTVVVLGGKALQESLLGGDVLPIN